MPSAADCGSGDAWKKRRPTKWVSPCACSALCQLILDDRYENRSSSWRYCRRRPAIPSALYAQHIAQFLLFDQPVSDMLYTFGGRNRRSGPVDLAEMLDTWHGCWVPLPPMPRRRAGSAATSLPDGRILIIGGYDQRGIVEGLVAECDVYDAVLDRWEKNGVGPLVRARWGHSCAVLKDQVFAVGGCALEEGAMETQRSCELYDPATDSWSLVAPLQTPRSGLRVLTLDAHRIAAVGGCADVFGRGMAQASVEIYSDSEKCWTTLIDTRLSIPRTSAAVACLGGGRQFFIAGGAPSQSSVEIFQVPSFAGHHRKSAGNVAVTDKNSALSSRIATRMGECAASDSDGNCSAICEEAVADMPQGRMGCQGAVVQLPRRRMGEETTSRYQTCVVIVGGELCDNDNGVVSAIPRIRQLSSALVYDLQAGAWLEPGTIPEMSTPRTSMASCLGWGRVVTARWSDELAEWHQIPAAAGANNWAIQNVFATDPFIFYSGGGPPHGDEKMLEGLATRMLQQRMC